MKRYDHKKVVTFDLFHQAQDEKKVKAKSKAKPYEEAAWIAEYRHNCRETTRLKELGKTDEEIISILGL